ncbi:hypothetical protein AB6A40_005097 [Gnathostoma spinigerum]|uniref:Uncharacterized protein n=1 Tax=Gnathostoma spinigerum TaxID=75299 RepID=A0ABD6EN39_9BILA
MSNLSVNILIILLILIALIAMTPTFYVFIYLGTAMITLPTEFSFYALSLHAMKIVFYPMIYVLFCSLYADICYPLVYTTFLYLFRKTWEDENSYRQSASDVESEEKTQNNSKVIQKARSAENFHEDQPKNLELFSEFGRSFSVLPVTIGAQDFVRH